MPSPALNERMNADFRYIWKHNIDGKIYRVFSFGLILYFHTNEIRYHYTLSYWSPFQLIPLGIIYHPAAWQDKRGQIENQATYKAKQNRRRFNVTQ